MRRVSGFTLVELIVVIAILAILAATAIPRFVDLSGNARSATASGIAGALASGAAVNYAAHLANNASATTFLSCASAAQVLQGGLPAGATVVGGSAATGSLMTCTVEYSASGGSASFAVQVIASSA